MGCNLVIWCTYVEEAALSIGQIKFLTGLILNELEPFKVEKNGNFSLFCTFSSSFYFISRVALMLA